MCCPFSDEIWDLIESVSGGFLTYSFDEEYRRLVEMEISEIRDLCDESSTLTSTITTGQVMEAISSLNRGKAADFYGLTAEHFIHGGEA